MTDKRGLPDEGKTMDACVGFGQYFATGEGGTFWIAVCNDEKSVRHLVAHNVDPFFQQFIDYESYSNLPPAWRRWIPEPIQKFMEGEAVHIEYFLKFHYNAA